MERGLLVSPRTKEQILMARQFWGAVSQGINYLDQLKRELHRKELSEKEIKDQLMAVLEQRIDTALAIIRPE